MPIPLKQSTAVTFRIGPFLDVDGNEKTGLTPTFELSKAHGAYGARSSATAPTHDSNAWYTCALNTTDTDTVGHLRVKSDDAANHLPVWIDFDVLPANVYDARYGTDKLQVDMVEWLGAAPAALISSRPDVNCQAMGATVLAAINAEVDGALNTAIPGSPTADSVNERLKTLDDNLTTTRAGYLDKLNITGNVAGSAEVLAIQNNTRIRIPVPGFLERPDSGSTAYELNIYLYDEAGGMEAPDSTPTIVARNEAGTDRSANLSAVSNVSAGHYKCTYTVASGHAIEQIMFEWSVVEGSTTRKHGASTQIVDTTAVDFTSADRTKLDAIKTKTDNLPANTATELATIAGYVDSETALIFTDTQAIKAAVDTEVAAIKAKTDNLPSNTASEIAAIKAKTDNLPAAPAAQTKLDAIHDGMTEPDGGVRRFTANALEQAPTGGGGGGGDSAETIAEEVLDRLATQKQEFDRAAGTLKSFKPDGTTVRGTLQLTETGADKVAMVSV